MLQGKIGSPKKFSKERDSPRRGMLQGERCSKERDSPRRECSKEKDAPRRKLLGEMISQE
jgi:hypothetical protein